MSTRRIIKNDPFANWEGDVVQFRLTYEGPLLAESSSRGKIPGRATNKQYIRKVFHKQLKRLWSTHPSFSGQWGEIQSDGFVTAMQKDYDLHHNLDNLTNRFERFGYRFIPSTTRTLGVMCGLDILFLRNDPPGAIVTGGDIDNRLKTLIDGLQMPRDKSQLGEYLQPGDGEDPFFCLLEDDSLITRLSVETDTLLQPLDDEPNVNDARVVITVTLKPYAMTADNYGFG